MKITFLTTNLGIGGAERTVSYLASDFIKRENTQVDIISLNGSNNFNFDNNIRLIKFNIQSEYNSKLEKYKHIIDRYVSIFNYLSKNKPDVIFCVLCQNIKYLKIFQKIFKYKIIVSLRTNPEFVEYEKFLKKADGIIFQTERAKKYYNQKIQEKSVVIQNAVGNPIVNKVNLPNERKKDICALGRVVKEKDYKTLIDAFCIVNEKHNDYTLSIYGDKPSKYSDEIHKYVNSLECSDKINIYPASTDALFEVNKSSCYVLSSICEGMPNALMEAMAIGMPCVATDCNNGPAELIKDGENGLLVPVQNPQAMAEAINKIIENKALAEKLAKNAVKIKETNSIEKISNCYYEYIKSFNE